MKLLEEKIKPIKIGELAQEDLQAIGNHNIDFRFVRVKDNIFALIGHFYGSTPHYEKLIDSFGDPHFVRTRHEECYLIEIKTEHCEDNWFDDNAFDDIPGFKGLQLKYCKELSQGIKLQTYEPFSVSMNISGYRSNSITKSFMTFLNKEYFLDSDKIRLSDDENRWYVSNSLRDKVLGGKEKDNPFFYPIHKTGLRLEIEDLSEFVEKFWDCEKIRNFILDDSDNYWWNTPNDKWIKKRLRNCKTGLEAAAALFEYRTRLKKETKYKVVEEYV